MAGMINQLISVMNTQAQNYEDLLGLSKEKKDVIIQNETAGLQKITNLENILISQNNRLEKTRLSLLKDIADVLGKNENEMTLSALIELMVGQAEQAELKTVGERIRAALEELSEVNELNTALIQNSLEYIEYSLNVIHSIVKTTPAAYPVNVKKGPATEEPGFFDAKH